MNKDLFDYELPKELIAQTPAEARDASRLLVVRRQAAEGGDVTNNSDAVRHRHFSDVPEYLRAGDVLVINDSKVIKARLIGVKTETGARVEVFLVKKRGQINHFTEDWEVLIRPGKRVRRGQRVKFADDFSCEVVGEIPGGGRIARFFFTGSFDESIDRLGKMPLPPYIKREAGAEDEERYQTVYAATPGSLAAPTAGLHFTPDLLAALEEKGVVIAPVTLHVGLGTFRPVMAEQIEDHKMHTESYVIGAETAERINAAKREGRRVVCVGTTSVRTLESAARRVGGETDNTGEPAYCVMPGEGETDIFIYPGYEFKIADALITNFHLPKSTLLMLVSAFAGRERMLGVYAEAIREGYRFFSYGDAMLIE
ncbi:MAG: tRNA preQ1(34) S-adenosylmethionine ribosyltransferase-isomerase QueA [Clostridiales Family XIII bacterium]|jgi:S-adenosylmethionine:tRNA ribosyltransferase-isomerase|nr:tRNA preQ1(34) S-adenosylmethionine ribosyltransferase-isomerase QueA [Clostridiales Family XIII bacterium]